MPHRLIGLESVIPDLTLNVLSFGIIALDITADIMNIIPDGASWVLVMSVAFLNVARGIAALKNGKKNTNA